MDEVKAVLVTADSAEASARELVRADLQTQIDGQGGAITSVRAYVDEVKAVLVTADSAEALARQTVRSDLEGMVNASTGLIEDLSAHVESVRQTLVGSDTAIAQSVDTLEATVTQNNRSSSFDAAVAWTFDVNTENWTVTGATSAVALGLLTVTSNSTTPKLSSPTITETVNGVEGRYVRALVRRKAGSGWTGAVYYKTAGHDFSESYKKVMAWPTVVNEWTLVEWDMHSLTAGGNDWRDSNILQIRLHLGASVSDVFEIDWIAIGRYGAAGVNRSGRVMSAAQALITAEESERANADSAETYQREQAVSTLQINIDNVAGDLADLDQTVINVSASLDSETQTRVSALAAEARARQAMAASLGSTKIYTQATAPAFDNVYPVGVNRLPNTRFDDGVGYWTGFDSAANASTPIHLDIAGGFIDGFHTAYVTRSGSMSASQYLRMESYFTPATAGKRFECSAYIVSVKSTAKMRLDFYDTNRAYISSSAWSISTSSSATMAGDDLTEYTRIDVASIAPANTVYAKQVIHAYGTGVTGAYLLCLRPMLTLTSTTAQSVYDWTPSNSDAQWINTGNNNIVYTLAYDPVNLIPGWAAAPDARIAANTSFITQVQETLVLADSAEAQSRLALEATVNSNRALVDFEACKTWTFDSSLDTWTVSGATATIVGGDVQLVSTSSDPKFTSANNLTLDADKYKVVRARIKRTAGTGWDGSLRFAVQGGHGLSAVAGQFLTVAGPTTAGAWATIDWDMSATDWSGVVTQLRIELGSTASDTFLIDWVSVGKYAPNNAQEGLATLGAGVTQLNTSVSGLTETVNTLVSDGSAQSTKLTELAATVTQNRQSASFDASKVYNFETIDWTAANAILTLTPDGVEVAATSSDPIIRSETLAIDGAHNRYVRMRIRRTAGSAWDGNLYYTTAGHNESFLYRKALPAASTDPIQSINTWTLLEWDMHALTVGGTDWRDNTITRIRLDLGNTASDVFEIDWIMIGRYGAGGNYLASQVDSKYNDIVTTLSTNLGSEVNTRTTLSSNFTKQVGNLRTFTVRAKGTAAVSTTAGLYADNDTSSMNTMASSYNVWVINRSDSSVASFTTYNVAASAANATSMAAALNALDNTKIVVIATYGDAKANRLSNGLDAAIYRCGGTQVVYGNTTYFKTGSAYILVGIPGGGEGSGAERYAGAVDADTNALISFTFSVRGGNIIGVAGAGLISSQIIKTAADIVTESNTRADAISAEAATRDALLATVTSTIGARKIFNQANQPSYDTLFPPNVNACPAAALEPLVLTNGAISFTGKAGWTAGCDLDVAHTLPGGHTLYVRHASSVSSAEFMSMMQFGGPTPWISAGNAYEFSAYVGATQCSQAFLRMTFYDINDAVINYISSYVNTNGGEWSSGLGDNGKVTTADYPANGDLSTYKRLWVHGVAPVNATSLKCQITAYGNNSTGFALYATRPFFGKMASGQTTPANWQSYDPPAWYDTDDGNKYYLWSGINGTGWVETTDTRTTNAASVTYVNQAVATETSARGTSESNILATVNDNQTKAAFDAAVTYAFDSADWTATGATVSASYGVFTVTSSSTSPIIISPALSVNGATNRYIRAKVRRTAGAGWKGHAGYTTAGHGFSASYYATTAFTAPLNTWVILEWDMHSLVAGGTDWRDNTITQIRLELGASASDVFEIDWVAVGRYGPGGVSASASVRSYAEGVAGLLSSETQARTDLASAFTSQIGNYKSYSIKTKGNAASATGLGLYINDVAAPQALANGYNVWVIARDTGAIVSFNTYNLNADAANATAMASALNALTNSSFVIIAAYNYSKTNRLVNGLDTAMYRCGASKAIYGADVSAFGAASPFKSNAAYILVGVPGDGEGSGVERYKGNVDSDVNAVISYSTALRNGQIVGLSGIGLLSAAISQTNADISNVNSTLTAADAAQATTSSQVSARMVFEGGGFMMNPAFANWPNGVTYPVGYSTWSTNSFGNGNAVSRVFGKKSPYALELVNAAGYQQGIFFDNLNGANASWIGSFGDRYIVIRIEFELVSGDLTNGGWMFRTYNASTLLTETKEMFSVTAPTPVVGRVYVIEKVVDLGAASATANGCYFWLFTSYAGFNSTYNAKRIRIHGCQMRAATNEEINTFTAGGPISTAISGAINTERSVRVSAEQVITNSVNTLTATVIKNQAYTDFEAGKVWNFETQESWTASGATASVSAGRLTLTSTSVSPLFTSASALAIPSKYSVVRARVKRLAGSAWVGALRFSIYNGHGFSTTSGQYATIADPTYISGIVNDWQILEWDMSGTDWSGVIDAIRLELGASSADSFLIDWVSVGRFGPSAAAENILAVNARITSTETAIADETAARTLAVNNATSSYTQALNDSKQKAAFDTSLVYNFDSVEGWTASGCNINATYGALTVTSTGTNPIIYSPNGVSITGSVNRYIRARMRRTSGVGWVGNVYYTTAGHGISASYKATASAPAVAVNEWTIVEWDMHSLVAGGTDWRDNTVTQIRLDLGNTASDVFEIDWIAIGRYGPGGNLQAVAVDAKYLDITNTLANSLGSEVSTRSLLSANFTTLSNNYSTQVGNVQTFSVAAKGGSATGAPGLFVNSSTSSANVVGRSYNVWVIDRTSGVINSFTTYDIYASATNATSMATALNALGTDKLVIIATNGDSSVNRLVNGLDTAMYRCGASRNVYGSQNYKVNAAYILVGVPGDGEGTGVERYKGSVDNATDAFVTFSCSLRNGFVAGVSGNPLLASTITSMQADIITERDTRTSESGAFATSLQTVSAKITPEPASMILNPVFNNWITGTYPAGFAVWTAPAGYTVNKVTGKRSQYAVELVAPSGGNSGFQFLTYNNPYWAGGFGVRYLVLSVEVELIAGNFVGAGVYLNSFSDSAGASAIPGASAQINLGTTYPAPVVGNTYSVTNVVDLTSASSAALCYRLYVMSNWTAFNASGTAKTIRIHRVQLRPATTEEINTFTAGGPISTAISAAVQAETTARVDDTSAIAQNLVTLSTTMGQAASRKVWRRTTAPAIDDMFPPCANRIWNSDIAEGASSWYVWTNSVNTASIGVDTSAEWKLVGEHTLYASISGIGSGKALDLGSAVKYPVTVGRSYEFSAYTGAHRCSTVLQIDVYTAAGALLATFDSSVTGQGSDLNTGVSNSVWGGQALSGYRRLWTFGVMPANASYCQVHARASDNGGVWPYVFLAHPYFGAMRSGQTAPSDYVPSQFDQLWYNTSDSNKPYILVYNSDWTWPTWTASHDTRVDSNTASLTQTMNTVNGLSVLYGIQGTINGQTGGFQFTGVLKNDGSVAYDLEIVSNVAILGDLLVAGTVRNAGLEDLAATNSLSASSPTGSNTTGDVTLYVRKNARVKLTVCQTVGSACDVQIYIGGSLYRTVNLAQHVSHVCIAPLIGANVLTNGTATASSTQSGYYASSAFDLNTASSWRSGALPTAGAPIYLTYQLPVAKSITQYTVTSKTYTGFTPPNGWVLQGSANGSTWVDIDTISSPGFSGMFMETKTYTIAATTAYPYFRLKFTTNAGYKIAVCEFAAYETAPGDQNIVFKATNSSVPSNVTGGVELIIEEFSK